MEQPKPASRAKLLGTKIIWGLYPGCAENGHDPERNRWIEIKSVRGAGIFPKRRPVFIQVN